jgi:hypothetical protein
MPQGYSTPANQILADLEGAVFHEYEIGPNATPASCIPGIVVKIDTAAATNYQVVEAGVEADDPLGVLDVENSELKTHAYSVGDICRVIERGKCYILLESGSAAVAPGDPLVCAADGRMILQATGLLGEQGAPPAYALEIADPALAETYCLAFFTGQREAATAA